VVNAQLLRFVDVDLDVDDASPRAPCLPQNCVAATRKFKWQCHSRRTQQLQLRMCAPFPPLSPSFPHLLLSSRQRAAADEAQRIAAFAFTMLN